MVQKGILPVFEVAISLKLEKPRQTKLACMHLTYSYLHEFFEPILIDSIFWRPWTIVHGQKGKFGHFWKWQYLWNRRSHAYQNWCPCIWHQSLLAWIFWSDSNELNFLTTMDYSPWLEREIWPFLKVTISPKLKRSRPEKVTPTKIGVYAFNINPYMHEFFEPIPMN